MHRQTRTLSPAFQPLFWISAIAAVKWNHPSHMPPTESQEQTSTCQGVESGRRSWVAPTADSPSFLKATAVLMPSHFFHVHQIPSLLLHVTFYGAREWERDSGLLTAPVPYYFVPTLNAFWNLHVDCMILHLMCSNQLAEQRKKPNVMWFMHLHIRGSREAFAHFTRHSHVFFIFKPDPKSSRMVNWEHTISHHAH